MAKASRGVVHARSYRLALREELGLTAREFPAGGEGRKIYLDAARRILLEPDLSWWSRERCLFIGDVKYKAVNVVGVKHPDIYQLLAYATASRLSHGLLIYAAGEGTPATHDVALAGKLRDVRSLRLSGELASLRSEIEGMATFIRSRVALSDGYAADLGAGARSERMVR